MAKRSEAAAAARPRRLALVVDATDTERRLIQQWLRSEGPDAATPAEMLVVADGTFAARLQRHGEVLVIPVRVVWLPRERDGDRRTRWSDLVLLANPRRPGPRRQQHIASREPDRCRIVAGEPALLSELRTRHQAGAQRQHEQQSSER